MVKEYAITVRGLVQGVGFRPFVYKLAEELNVSGTVENRTDCVAITLQASEVDKEIFLTRLYNEKPKVAKVNSIEVVEQPISNTHNGFIINPSNVLNNDITNISPDIAICDDCLRDIKEQPQRKNHPFISCTNCGPRFSIIKSLPYDRPNTTMAEFKMCSSCKDEYQHVKDRRFHAQPIACNRCGPTYFINHKNNNFNKILTEAISRIDKGHIIAVKGIGGYNIICDALNNNTVKKLREIKNREGKPFAVMFSSVKLIDEYCYVNSTETEELTSWRKPIVLLKQKKEISHEVNLGLNRVGVMLPYLPIHHMLFDKLKTKCLVFTSGNISGEPIAISAIEANSMLKNKVDFIVHNSREIYNRVDDSVVQVIDNDISIVRRARGFVPEPFYTPENVDGVVALGAELTNTFAIGKNKQVIISQHIGDLKNNETYNFYEATLDRFIELFKVRPKLLVCDKHPDYLSTRKAEELSRALSIPLIKVQHHHAHAISVLMEHGLDENVIALVLDGTGYGDDGNIWGGEVLFCNKTNYRRLDHFEYVSMPGGDSASEEPWRMAVSYVYHYLKDEPKYLEFVHQRYSNSEVIERMIKKGINSPLTSSAGRLFDAVASILGICDFSTFQAEAPIRLQSIAAEEFDLTYSYNRNKLSFKSVIKGIIDDKIKEVEPSLISAKFHNTLASMLCDSALFHAKQNELDSIVLSGGTFQNGRLLSQLSKKLNSCGLKVFYPTKIPANDGGISLGQVGIGANYLFVS